MIPHGFTFFFQGIMSPELSSLLFLVVGISMALTPYLAAGGQLIASRFELQDVRSLLPDESEVLPPTFGGTSFLLWFLARMKLMNRVDVCQFLYFDT